MEAGAPVLDHGLGVFALTCRRPPSESGPLVIDQLHALSGPADLDRRFKHLEANLDMELLWPLSRPGVPKTFSEVTDDHNPVAFKAVMRFFDFAKDGIGLAAFEPSGHGVFLVLPLSKVTALTDRARERWQMLAAHFGAGYRLRRAIERDGPPSTTDLPFGAEALIDPMDFRVAEATGEAASRPALASLREAARQVDQARGQLRRSDPHKALELWRALVRGRWSTADWFDSDGRRYVLCIPNAPNVTDPRGLTERETQVVFYTAYGLTNKMIAYHLGVSTGRVSTILHSAMKKLGVHTRAQLIKQLKDFESVSGV